MCRKKISKEHKGIFRPFFPIEVDQHILKFIATNSGGESLQEAAQIFNALYCTNKFLHQYLNDSQRTLIYIKEFSQKFNCSNENVTALLCTPASRFRYHLQRSFIATMNYTFPKQHLERAIRDGADINFTYVHSRTYLQHIATHLHLHNHDNIIWAINRGADMNVKNDGSVAMHILFTLMRQNLTEDDQLLIDFILNHPNFLVNDTDNQGDTLLHCLLYYYESLHLLDHLLIAYAKKIHSRLHLLLQKGADPNIRNNKNQTALDLAKAIPHHSLSEIIELLKNYMNYTEHYL